jgi:uncharacterized membrane protein YtjA (UPF0391 family)
MPGQRPRRRKDHGTGPDVRTLNSANSQREVSMLYWAAVFFVVAIVAGILGFGGIATAAAGIAKILFWIFLVVFLVTLVAGFLIGRKIF